MEAKTAVPTCTEISDHGQDILEKFIELQEKNLEYQ
jgi:hypothetical protein